MAKWYKIPAFKALLLLLPALIVGLKFDLQILELILITGIGIIISVVLFYFNKSFIAFFIILSCVGLIISQRASDKIIEFPDKTIPDIETIFTGKILKIHKRSEKYIRFTAEGQLRLRSLGNIDNERVMFTCFIEESNPEYKQILENAEIYSEANLSFAPAKLLPNEFDSRKYLKSLSVNWNATTSTKKISVKKSPDLFHQKIYRIREIIGNRIYTTFNPYTAGIIKAMLLGDKSDIDYETKQRFSFSGTAHLLAISGLHVGLIASIIHFILVPFIRNKYFKTILFALIIIIFIYVSGFQDSAVRAGMMAIIWSFSYLTTRRIEPLNVASLVILFMMVFNPSYIYSVSFQMSASAIIGILIFYNLFRNFFQRIIKNKSIILRFITESFSLTLSASIVVSPLVAYYFGVFSIISPVANLIVLPLMSLALLYAIISIGLSFILIYAASIFAGSTEFLVEISDLLNSLFIELPYSFTNSKEIAIIYSILLSISVIYLFSSQRRRQAIFRFSIVSVVFFISFLIINKLDFQSSDEFIIYPRNQFVMLEINDDNRNQIFVFDRKPSQNPRNDFQIMNYLKNKSYDFDYYYTGNAGINVADYIKKHRQILPKTLSIEQQIQLKKLLKINKNFSQIIE